MPRPLMLLALACSPALAQDDPPPQFGPASEFTPVMEVRARVQVNWTNGLADGVLQDSFLLQRARLGFRFHRGPVYADLTVQQWMGWTPNPADVDGEPYVLQPPRVEFWQAWAQWKKHLPAELFFAATVGRQTRTLHEGRLIAEYDWSDRGNYMDGLALDFAAGIFHLTLFNWRDFENVASVTSPGNTLLVLGARDEGVRYHWHADLVSVIDATGPENTAILGVNGAYRGPVGHGGVEAYLYGTSPVTEEASLDGVTSLLASTWGGVTLGPQRLWTGRLQFDALADNLDPASDRPGGFRAPLPDLYRFNGHLGVFNRPVDSGYRGLLNPQLRNTLHLGPHFDIELDFHAFWTFREPDYLGNETDLTLRYMSALVSLESGLFLFFSPDDNIPGFYFQARFRL